MIERQKKESELKRDPAIELSRLLGCLIVIGCHTYLGTRIDGIYDTSRLYIAMLFADGVAVFWLIGGAFLFDNKDYKELLVRTIKKIFLPMLLVGVLYFYYASWQSGNTTFHDIIFNYQDGYKAVFLNLLKWRNGITSYGHSWYIYIYILLMCSFPALKGVVEYVDKEPKRKYVLLSGVLLLFAWNDISHNQLASFSHYVFNGLVAAILITFIGYYLYKERDNFRKKRWVLLSPLLFMAVNLLRVKIQLYREGNGYGDDISIMCWYSVLGVLAASAIVIFCLALITNKKASVVNRIICYFASYTFPIYLIHILLRNIYDSVGLRSSMQRMILGWNAGVLGEVIYMILIVSIVFWSSFFVAFLLRMLRRLLLKGICFIKKCRSS